MPKAFFTERDIEELVERGVTGMEVSDDVVLTELAREKAHLLGFNLVRRKPEAASPPALALPASPSVQFAAPEGAPESKLHLRIRGAVLAQLGDQIDPVLVDRIIQRVLISTGAR